MTEQQSNILKIAAVVVLLLIGTKVYRKTRGKKNAMRQNNFTPEDAKKAILKLKQKQGQDIAELIERVIRRETAHFTSGQYKRTGSPGMETGYINGDTDKPKKQFPYGWALRDFWTKNPKYAPSGTYTMPENKTGIKKTFIVFPSVEAATFTLAEHLRKKNWNAGAWYSTKPSLQADYNRELNRIIPRFART